MNFGQQILHELEAKKRHSVHSNRSPGTAGDGFEVRFRVSANDGRMETLADVCELDQFSCVVNELRCLTPAPQQETPDVMKGVQRLTQKVSYLLEDLRLHEGEEDRQLALVRSVAPFRGSDSIAYYEVRLDSRSLRFARYRLRKGQHTREQIPFFMTREVLERLVNDLAATFRHETG